MISVRNLQAGEWLDLFNWVEQVLVDDYGLYLPAWWFTYVGIATECLHLCVQYLAVQRSNRLLTSWFRDLDAFAHRVGIPWTLDEIDIRPNDARGMISRVGSLHWAELVGVRREKRASRYQFRFWLASEGRPRQLPFGLARIEALVEQIDGNKEN